MNPREIIIQLRAAALDARHHNVAETLLEAAKLLERQAAIIASHREDERDIERQIRDAWREGRADAQYEQQERERWEGGYP